MSTKKPIVNSLDRRTFLQGVLAAGAYTALPIGVFGAASRPRKISPNDKVNMAFVGIGNRGSDDLHGFAATGQVNVVALCDTEIGSKRTADSLGKFPDAQRFQDFRKMFDQIGSQFDAVCIATPDHAHFAIAMLAMSMGKHVYVEKPLAHSFHQIELLMASEKKHKVATQMGNQGTAANGLRRAAELLRAGELGDGVDAGRQAGGGKVGVQEVVALGDDQAPDIFRPYCEYVAVVDAMHNETMSTW